jgi:hypothetical protein
MIEEAIERKDVKRHKAFKKTLKADKKRKAKLDEVGPCLI